jgi:hypothetical protein
MTPGHPIPLLIPAVFALALGAGGALADPLPEGTAAPSAPDTPAPPDKGQPPPVMEQHDVPPVAPQEEQPAAKPDAEKNATDAGASAKSAETQKAEAAKNVEPVAPDQAFSILGKKVHGPDGKDVFGSIIDILVDDQGQPRAAVVDFGGFLGVGSRKIAVDWQLLKFQPADAAAPIVLDLDRKQIQDAPEYKDPTQPAEVVEPALVDIQPLPPVTDAVATPTTPADKPAPADTPPPAPRAAPPGSVATPAPPSPDAAAPPDADKHTN